MSLSRRNFLKGVAALTGAVALAPYGRALPLLEAPPAPFVPAPLRITVPSGLGGMYLVSSRVTFDTASLVGPQWVAVSLNGRPIASNFIQNTDIAHFQSVLALTTGDTVEMVAAEGAKGSWSVMRLAS